ncbi:MAG: hypothetical protein ACPGWR_10430, partial [Ardenticatenaceae bacterium]
KQGCVFYRLRTSRDACSTTCEQAGMRVLPPANKQGCVFYPCEQAGMRVLPPANKQGCVFYPCQQAGMRVLPPANKQGCVFYQSLMNKLG